MKTLFKSFFLFVSISTLATMTIEAQGRKDLVGNWDAQIPYAPEEFQKAVVKITQDSVFMSIDGIHFAPALVSEFKNDTLKYEMQEASVEIIFESTTKLKGIAKWPYGQSEMTLTKKSLTEPGPVTMNP